ncbi:MAG: 4Fe-4S ferredoxin [Desulfobacterales bacterium]|nr:4Fe-4S ferredoxin [Desulfobacterales bacterium]
MEDVYEKLQLRLDQISTGFPATENGIEIDILKKLFTEEEADFFLKLTPMVETPADIAARLDLDADETAEKLEGMAKKGLLFRLRKGDLVRYSAAPYIVGIFEHQLNTLDEDLAKDMEKYFDAGFGKSIMANKTPLMRTVPVNREISARWPVAPYEDVLTILEGQKKIALAPCICRKTAGLAGKGCDKPEEVCMIFGSYADYYVENGMGRHIDVEEAKKVAKISEEAGLVLQPFNSKKVGGMCSCCGDCCGLLRSLKLQPSPAEAVQSNYFAVVDEEACVGCETCVERCQMDAVEMVDDIARVALNRCIGCGLCVTTCDVDAMHLEKKPEDKLYVPPENGMGTYMNIAVERGIM